MFANLKVAPKLGLASTLFLGPIGFLMWMLVAAQNAEITFTRQEQRGAEYLAALAVPHGAALQLALTGGDSASLADAVTKIQATFGEGLQVEVAARAVIDALRRGGGLEDARGTFRDLFSKLGERSNLILDNFFVTLYLTDVVLSRLPDQLDRIADLALAQADSQASPAAQARFLGGLGELDMITTATDTAIAASIDAPGGDVIRTALHDSYQKLRVGQSALTAALRTGSATKDQARAILGETSAFQVQAATILASALRVRVSDLQLTQLRQLAVTVGLFMLALLTVLFTVRSGVTKPLGQLRIATLELANGNLETKLPDANSADEIGDIARALAIFQRQGLDRQALETAAATARGMRERGQAAMAIHTENFSQSIAGVLASLGSSATAMRKAANQLTEAVSGTNSASIATVIGAEQSARDLATVAAATEQLTASVDEIARQIVQAARAAQQAVVRANAAGATVHGLNEAAGHIDSVVRLIADIASKTNLLALNATIEAARAGDAGKGFAVVASEVKALAAQTAKATSEISSQIGAIQAASRDAAEAVQGVSAAIGELDHITSAISAAVEQQGAATREIAANLQTVTRQNTDTTQAMKNVAQVAANASLSSQAVLTTADDLAKVSSDLKDEVEHFLGSVRSETGERRRWERVPAGDATISLNRVGSDVQAGTLVDLSRGGALIRTVMTANPGDAISCVLPGDSGQVSARLVRSTQTTIAVCFSQDPASLARVDRALARLAQAKAA